MRSFPNRKWEKASSGRRPESTTRRERRKEGMSHVYEVSPNGAAVRVSMEAGSGQPRRGVLLHKGRVRHQGARRVQGGGHGRSARSRATLRDHARGYGWSRMSWRVKLLIVFVILWAMGTINQRLGADLDPASPIVSQPARECAEDEVLDPREMSCIHIEIIESGYYK